MAGKKDILKTLLTFFLPSINCPDLVTKWMIKKKVGRIISIPDLEFNSLGLLIVSLKNRNMLCYKGRGMKLYTIKNNRPHLSWVTTTGSSDSLEMNMLLIQQKDKHATNKDLFFLAQGAFSGLPLFDTASIRSSETNRMFLKEEMLHWILGKVQKLILGWSIMFSTRELPVIIITLLPTHNMIYLDVALWINSL